MIASNDEVSQWLDNPRILVIRGTRSGPTESRPVRRTACHPVPSIRPSRRRARWAEIKPVDEIPDGLVPKWERRALGRFHYEIRALEVVVGASLRIDEDALAVGALIVEFEWPLDGQLVPLRAIYPDSFPRLRPHVRLRGDPATFRRRHRSPIEGNLCLLGRDSRQWRQKWTLRELLELQLADALNETGEEDEQGEPAEYWWNVLGRRGCYCLVDTAWTLEGATHGTLALRYCLHKTQGELDIQAAVTEVRNQNDVILHTWSGALPPTLAEGAKAIIIPWVYIDEPLLPRGDQEQIFELMGGVPKRPRVDQLSISTTGLAFAVVYRSELTFQSEGLGWLFPFLIGPKKVFNASKADKTGRRPRVVILPTYRAGGLDLGARVPGVQILREKKIAVVGLGAVGAPLAVELARNGCSLLHMVDYDTVEPGNSIRWPLGASAWGIKKSDSLPAFIRREYPWTAVQGHDHAIGTFKDNDPEAGDDSLLAAIVPDVDLVVDSTASDGVARILSDHCRERGIWLISLYASPPVHGGVVARFAAESGCPTCLEFAHHAGVIQRAPGFGDESALQQPPGCAERTFTGASYDLQELSLQAMRLIIETLENPADARESVVQTLSLVTDGRRAPPAWRVDRLPKAQECSCATAP